jgi:hypothetical protein
MINGINQSAVLNQHIEASRTTLDILYQCKDVANKQLFQVLRRFKQPFQITLEFSGPVDANIWKN